MMSHETPTKWALRIEVGWLLVQGFAVSLQNNEAKSTVLPYMEVKVQAMVMSNYVPVRQYVTKILHNPACIYI